MLYHEFKNEKLSALGLGCMRLPLVEGSEGVIDENAVAEMVEYAIQNGINYFDTAWGYHGGKSEIVMGNVLSKYPRESFYLATKMPGFSPENFRDHKQIFEKQLEKCQTTYFDFYMFHNVAEKNIDDFMGVADFLIEQKKCGKIRHLGFSTHGSIATMRRFLEKYASELEFCQIQLNYLDWKLQNAREKVALLNEFNIPVWVMEPVRGGRLVALDEEYMDVLQKLRPGVSSPEWAFRFLQGIGEVKMILSGMSNMDQLKQNVATFSEHKPLNEQEMEAIMAISDGMISKNAVPCTACGYCLDNCPQGLAIPDLIKLYNEKCVPIEPGPDSCVGCRSCEHVCPQGIRISEVMAAFAARN